MVVVARDGGEGVVVKSKPASSRDFSGINLGRQQIPRIHLLDQNFPFSFSRLTYMSLIIIIGLLTGMLWHPCMLLYSAK